MASSTQSLLKLDGVQKVFYTDEVETHALDNIHLEIENGEFVSIAGPSGCGKSTLLSILGLLDSPTGGSYWLNGKPVENLSLAERARIRNRVQADFRQPLGLAFAGLRLDSQNVPIARASIGLARRSFALRLVHLAHFSPHLFQCPKIASPAPHHHRTLQREVRVVRTGFRGGPRPHFPHLPHRTFQGADGSQFRLGPRPCRQSRTARPGR